MWEITKAVALVMCWFLMAGGTAFVLVCLMLLLHSLIKTLGLEKKGRE